MRLSELLLRLSDELDDAGLVNWPEAQRVRWADVVVQSMNRQLVEVDKGYSDCEVFIRTDDWTAKLNLTQDYRLPQWVGNVVEVWRLDQDPDTQNPYTSAVSVQRGSPIYKTNQRSDPGWIYTQRNVLRLESASDGYPVVAKVAKRPARLLRVALTKDATGASTADIPQSIGASDVGTIHLEQDWYRNEQFYVFSTNQTPSAHLVVGDSRRCVASQPNVDVGGTLYTRLTFDSAWGATLREGDVLEMELAIPDEHSELVVLEVCKHAFIKKESRDGLAAIAGPLAESRAAYRAFIQPRGMREPDFYRTDGLRQATDWQGRKDPEWENYV